jgi:hypothetical protein
MAVVSLRSGAALAAVAGLWLAAAPTYAVDGVVLIDEAAVLAGGITPADGPGYPVTISEPGSYRLSENLKVPAGVSGLWIETNDATLDLNGFGVLGANSPFTDGIFIFGNNVEVRSGTVREFGRHGIFSRNAGRCFDCTDAEGVRIVDVRAIGNGFNGIRLESQGGLVEGCSAHANGNAGINAQGNGTLVKNSVARVNKTYGIIGGSNSGYRSNVLTANNGGDLNPQVLGGVNLGENLCGTAVCP